MRRIARWSCLLPWLAAALVLALAPEPGARAGGPLYVGGPMDATPGAPFLWDTAQPVAYRVDGGPLARRPDGTVVIANAAALDRVQNMFRAWEDVPTAAIRYTNAGPILPAGSFPGGEVATADHLFDVAQSCIAGVQSPIVFDADGSIFQQLVGDSSIIGFAGACAFDEAEMRILAGWAVMNGRFQDGINQPNASPPNYELTPAEFDEAFTHEFGHFSGLDHSQINVEVLDGFGACSADDLAGLPLMFPFLVCQARSTAGLPLLSPDDRAWISMLYPETANNPPTQVPFASQYAILRGRVLFSDGLTAVFDTNVIARALNDPATPENEALRHAVAVVSGYRFTGWFGQPVTGNSPGSGFGSRDPRLIGLYEIPVPAGTYTVEVEAVFFAFIGGSRVGPAFLHFPLPGPPEFWNVDESDSDDPAAFTPVVVVPGMSVEGLDIILNGTPPRFDAFEGPDPPQASQLPGAAGQRTGRRR